MNTTSAIISVDGWYQYVRQWCPGIPMAIKNQVVDTAEFLDTGEVKTSEPKQTMTEYSFLDDEIIETDCLIDPMVIIPQEGLRYSIINIISYCISTLVNDYVDKYCRNAHTTNERPCLLVLKNEFLMARVLVNKEAKKNYASKMELQEGNPIPEKEALDIKGMPVFIKSTGNAAVQEKLKRVLYEDILNSDFIDRNKVLQDLAIIEKEIFDSINRGEKKFFRPLKVKSLASYENPMRIHGIVASYAYNALHEPGTEALDLTIRNTVDIVKVDISKKNIDRIKDTFPYVYEKAIKLMDTPEFATGISAIALPQNEELPGWVLPFIEYKIIINDNLTGFPIESIGIYRGASTNNSTNIISF